MLLRDKLRSLFGLRGNLPALALSEVISNTGWNMRSVVWQPYVLSLGATVLHGYLVENGEVTKPIKGVVISGNFYELLKEGIEVGSDLRNSFHYYSPTVKLAQLTIAGK